MGKKAKLGILAVSVAAVLALSLGTVAMAAGPNNTDSKGACFGLGAGFSRQGICSDEVCTLLGLAPEEIREMRQEGNSLVEIAADKGISEQQLVEAIMAARKAEVQARVTAGTLTQERANVMLQNMEQNVVRAVNRVTIGQPEWAGANGGSQSGMGTGTAQMKQRGQDSGKASYGEPVLGTGPGSMHQWGKGAR